MRNPTPISVMKSSNPLDDSSSNLPSMYGSSAAWPEAAARRAESSSRGSMVRVVVRVVVVVCVDWAVTTFQLAGYRPQVTTKHWRWGDSSGHLLAP